jgi:hypothetical protein
LVATALAAAGEWCRRGSGSRPAIPGGIAHTDPDGIRGVLGIINEIYVPGLQTMRCLTADLQRR